MDERTPASCAWAQQETHPRRCRRLFVDPKPLPEAASESKQPPSMRKWGIVAIINELTRFTSNV